MALKSKPNSFHLIFTLNYSYVNKFRNFDVGRIFSVKILPKFELFSCHFGWKHFLSLFPKSRSVWVVGAKREIKRIMAIGNSRMEGLYHDFGCGVSFWGIQNYANFFLKVNWFKGHLYFFFNWIRQKFRNLDF